ncbi:MAG: MmcQ/YjbR family DNA-binding protein [Candidatus Cloacimonetes bacterium]|nr:MmcQ/YjbR family DNA-binding protein [Candidatus Cloacimonadota bacterium]
MTPDAVHDYCRRMPGAWEDFPFDEVTLVMKVSKKLFAILGTDRPLRISLKCDPGRVDALREEHPAITPGYYLSKRHWNTIVCDGSVPDELLCELIDHSYELVLASLTKKERQKIADEA